MSNKSLPERIAYYTKKVAQASGSYPNPHRHKRIMAYKAAMHKQIRKEKPEIYDKYYPE